MNDWNPSYQDLKDTYRAHFSLGNLNTDMGNKFALISLVCFLTKQARVKNPDANCWRVLMKIIDGHENEYDIQFLKGLAIVCDDYMTHCNEFLTFDMKSSKQIVAKIQEILKTWLPF